MSVSRANPFSGIAIIICIALVVPCIAILADAQTSGNLPRGSRFTVSITGQPNTVYYVWDANTFSMSGSPGDQPPIIAGGTLNLQKDPPGGPYVIGMHTTSSGGTIIDDVAPSYGDFSNTQYYAQITTDENGQALVEFLTGLNTATQHFAIKVEDQGGNPGQLQVQANLYPRTAPSITVIPTTMVTTTAALPPTTIPIPTTLPTTLPTTVAPILVTVTPVPTTTETPAVSLPVGLSLGAIYLCLLGLRRK